MIEYYQNNKEKMNKYTKQYLLDNPEYIQNWREDNKNELKKYNKQYKKNNPGKVALNRIKNKTNRNLRVPKWLSKEEKKQIELFYDNCPEGYVVDHIIPLQGKEVSGLHRINNLQYLTELENSKKLNHYPIN